MVNIRLRVRRCIGHVVVTVHLCSPVCYIQLERKQYCLSVGKLQGPMGSEIVSIKLTLSKRARAGEILQALTYTVISGLGMSTSDDAESGPEVDFRCLRMR